LRGFDESQFQNFIVQCLFVNYNVYPPILSGAQDAIDSASAQVDSEAKVNPKEKMLKAKGKQAMRSLMRRAKESYYNSPVDFKFDLKKHLVVLSKQVEATLKAPGHNISENTVYELFNKNDTSEFADGNRVNEKLFINKKNYNVDGTLNNKCVVVSPAGAGSSTKAIFKVKVNESCFLKDKNAPQSIPLSNSQRTISPPPPSNVSGGSSVDNFKTYMYVKEIDSQFNPYENENLIAQLNSPQAMLPRKDRILGTPLPILTLPEIVFNYIAPDSSEHWVEVLHAAKGKNLFDILTNSMKKIIDSSTAADELNNTLLPIFKSFGKSLAAFHRHSMNIRELEKIYKSSGKISASDIKCYTHHDLHFRNVFADKLPSSSSYTFYLIDNESMAYSLSRKKGSYGENPFDDFLYFIELPIFYWTFDNLEITTVQNPEERINVFMKAIDAFIKSYFDELSRFDNTSPASLYKEDLMKAIVKELKQDLLANLIDHYSDYKIGKPFSMERGVSIPKCTDQFVLKHTSFALYNFLISIDSYLRA
jgi:hypothetical protein